SLHVAPSAIGDAESNPLAGLALPPDQGSDAFELRRHALIGTDNFVKSIGDLSHDADLIAGHPDRKVTDPNRLQREEQARELSRRNPVGAAEGLDHGGGRWSVRLAISDRRI